MSHKVNWLRRPIDAHHWPGSSSMTWKRAYSFPVEEKGGIEVGPVSSRQIFHSATSGSQVTKIYWNPQVLRGCDTQWNSADGRPITVFHVRTSPTNKSKRRGGHTLETFNCLVHVPVLVYKGTARYRHRFIWTCSFTHFPNIWVSSFSAAAC